MDLSVTETAFADETIARVLAAAGLQVTFAGASLGEALSTHLDFVRYGYPDLWRIVLERLRVTADGDELIALLEGGPCDD